MGGLLLLLFYWVCVIVYIKSWLKEPVPKKQPPQKDLSVKL